MVPRSKPKGKTAPYTVKSLMGIPKLNEGGKTENPESSEKAEYNNPTMADIARIRRTGSLPGWESVPNEDGSMTFRKNSDLFNLVNHSIGADRAISRFPDLSLESMQELDTELPNMAGTRDVSQFLKLTPEIQNADYSEINLSLLPGFASQQSGTQGGITEFNFRKEAPEVNTRLAPLKTERIPLQKSRKKGLPNVLYTPDGVKMSDYIESLKRQTARNEAHNSQVDFLNLLKGDYNKQRVPNTSVAMRAKGGVISGPSHEEGGVQVFSKGKHVAEVEGGERLFSVEDTNEIDRLVAEMAKRPSKKKAAMLGKKVTSMVKKQEAADKQRQLMRAMNSFATDPDNSQEYTEIYD